MDTSIGQAIVCPLCGRRYAGNRRMRGGSFPCWCGHRIAVPAAGNDESASERASPSADVAMAPPPDPAPELELAPERDAPPDLQLAPAPEPEPADSQSASAPRLLVSGDLLAKYGLPPTSTSRYVTEEDDEGSAFTNTVLPVVLLAVGVVLWLGQAGYVSQDPTQSLPRVAALVVLGLVLNIAVTVAGCLIAAMLFNLNFGTVGTTILKLVAIAVIAGALGSLIIGMDRDRFSITGMIVAWHMVILTYFVCFCIFFTFDLQENLATVAIIGLMQALALLMIWAR